MFSQEAIVIYFRSSKPHKKVTLCINKVQQRQSELDDSQSIGIVMAAFALGEPAWTNSVIMINQMKSAKKA